MKILVLDIETTGFSHSKNHILEIGAVELNLLTKERKIVYNKTILEKDCSIQDLEDSWIVSNSDIIEDYYENMVTIQEAKIEFQKVLDEYPLGYTAFNRKFDEGFLIDRGFKMPKALPCPMLVLTDIMKLKSKQKWKKGYKWPNVQEAYDYFFPNNNYIEKHRGADDAMHEAEIVQKLYELDKFEV